MMFTISPLLALIALRRHPAVGVVTAPDRQAVAEAVHRAVEAHRRAQRAHRGVVHRAPAGEGVRPAGGVGGGVPRAATSELYEASSGAQFVSGLIMPSMMFLSNLSYVVIAVVGGLRITSGTMTLGEVQAFIQYSRQFTQPLTQVASMANLHAVRGRVGRAGVRAARRRGAGAGPGGRDAARRTRRGRVEFEHVSFSYRPEQPLIEDLSLVAEPGQTVAIVGPDRCRQDHAREPDHAVLRAGRRPDHARRRGHHGVAAARTCGRRSAWCCRTPGCSAAPSATTSPTASRARPRRRSSRPRRRPTSTVSSAPCPTATTR